MNTPERTTAAAFPQYLGGRVLADSAALHWPSLYARHFRFPRVVDRFLVPATAEPLVSCGLAGTAEFREREPGGPWIVRTIGPGDFFVTRSRTPYEVRFASPPGQELETISIHLAVEPFRAALEAAHPGRADEVDLGDYFGRDEDFMRLCLLCAGMLAARTPGSSRRVAGLTGLFASSLAERYTALAPEKPDFRGGLPIR